MPAYTKPRLFLLRTKWFPGEHRRYPLWRDAAQGSSWNKVPPSQLSTTRRFASFSEAAGLSQSTPGDPTKQHHFRKPLPVKDGAF